MSHQGGYSAGARRPPLVVAVSGFSGAGKTRLLARLIPALARRGVSTAVVKHTRHPHDLDRPGKDTHVLRRAGAVAAIIEGPAEMAWFGPPAGGLRALVRLLPAVDLVLAEGFKDDPVPRIEVHRRSIAREFLCAKDPRVFAVVSDEPPPRPVRAFRARDVEPLAMLVVSLLRRSRKPPGPARLRVRPSVRRVRAEGSGRTAAPRRRRRMAKTTTKGGSSRRGAGRRSGASRSTAGRKGGNATLRTRGAEFYKEIGSKGGKKSNARRGRRPAAKATARAASRPGAGSRKKKTTRRAPSGGAKR
jgi:molybdopterin-guanine dinucleotide biosynthesis adapter protein